MEVAGKDKILPRKSELMRRLDLTDYLLLGGDMAKKVLVYSTPTCPYCTRVKQFLTDNNIAFEDFNVAADKIKAQEMIDKSDQMGVPVLDIEGNIIIGFDKEKISQILDL